MRKIIFPKQEEIETISYLSIGMGKPIFAKQEGKLQGMVVKEDDGWVLKTGGDCGATGYHNSREECLESCLKYDYEFYVED